MPEYRSPDGAGSMDRGDGVESARSACFEDELTPVRDPYVLRLAWALCEAEVATIEDVQHHLVCVGVFLLQQREGEDAWGDTEVTDRSLGKELHRVEDVEILRHAEDLLFVELALELSHHQQPVAVLTEADAPVKPMEEEMDEDIDDIQLVGERLDGVVPMMLGDEAPTADSLLDEGIEVSIVALVVEEDGTSVVLHDGTAVGEGRMAIAHLGVIV